MGPNRGLVKCLLVFTAVFISLSILALPSQAEPASPANACISGTQDTWNNASFATQSALFTAAYDATPGQNDMDGVIGFSLNSATGYTSLAAITRFNSSGMIDVRNGGNYAADLSLPYTAGQPYHFRLVINPTTHQYSVYVTPPGGSELALASNYAFRSEQSNTSSLNNWAIYPLIGTETVCNMTIAASSGSTVVAPTITTQPASQTITAGQTATFSVVATGTAPLSYQWRQNGVNISSATSSSYTTPAGTTSATGAKFTVVVSNSAGTVTSAAATLYVSAAQVCLSGVQGTWKNTSFVTQTAQFTATYDATPSQNNMDAVTGFSLNAATAYTSLAAITRFNSSGMIDARNGGTYAADISLPYTAGQPYHFRLVINPATQHYSVYVTPLGGSELALGSNYVFRSEQSATSSLNNWAIYPLIGTESICNMTIAANTGTGSTTVAPTITTPPASQAIIAGQTATFSVAATGTSPLSYQWQKNGAAIAGATSSSYATPAETVSDNNAHFSVSVSNTAGSVTSAAATLTVTAPGTLSTSSSTLAFGNVNVGTSANLSATLTNSGSSSVTVSGVSISGPGFSASGISVGQIIPPGQTATVNLTFTPAATGSVTGNITITSNASNSPTIISFTGTGAAIVSHSATLTWTASTSAVIGYNVYRGTVSGGPFTRLTASVDATLTYSDNSVQAGQTYYYVVTAVGSNNIESVYSNQASATIP